MGYRAPLQSAQRLLPAVLAAALLAAPAGVHAQSYTESVTLQATVVKTCTVFAVPLMFGNVPRMNPSVDAQTNIIVTCTPDTPFVVAIDDGQNFGGGSRRMQRLGNGGGGQKWLDYELYRNAARTARWGSTAGQSVSGTAPSNGNPVVLPVYGRASGNVIAGPYMDVVTVSLSF